MAFRFPPDVDSQIACIKDKRVIQTLAIKSRNLKHVPDVSIEPFKTLVAQMDALLDALDGVEMTPRLRHGSRIDDILKLVFADPSYHFSPAHQDRARALFTKWESENWGAAHEHVSAPTDDVETSRSEAVASTSTAHRAPSARSLADIHPPPPSHQIWGTSGIMHGLAYRVHAGRKSVVLNPVYSSSKRSSHVFGHNSLPVGSWFPNRLSALFHGAHGATQAGISGSSSGGGAYSIVVSGLYDLLDHDRGQVLFYSGSGSHDNTDPDEPAEATEGTRSLHASLQSAKPVRVLRTKDAAGMYAPSVGIRYDGLYTVVRRRLPKNEKGGRYEQFELRRLDGQMDLDECRKRPNGKEWWEMERISEGYGNRR